MENAVLIRPVQEADSSRLAELAEQLGYPCKVESVGMRISQYIDSDARTILVAESGGEVVAWTSMDVIDHFYLEPFVEISGFVVDKKCRSMGIGGKLMAEAEKWTMGKGFDTVRLKTNAIRKDAHRFYEGLGFEKTKEQYVYIKKLR